MARATSLTQGQTVSVVQRTADLGNFFLIGFRVRPGLPRIAIRHRQSEQKADLTGAIPLLYEFNNPSGSEIADENSPI
jgi:hypothetical protein